MYTNEKDNGRNGRNFEVDFRLLITEKAEACHRQGVADIVVKMGVTLECKTAQPQLTAPIYNSKEEAENAIANGFKMSKAMFVAYLPTYNGNNAEEAIIVSQKTFIEIFRKHGKLRAKRHSNGKWCIAIQQYIPTPTFKASQKTYDAIITDLFNNGEYYDTFMERMGLI
jgi:hypothetical protein